MYHSQLCNPWQCKNIKARAALGGHYQQEVHLLSLFKDVANDFVQMCVDPSQIHHLIDRAIRVALAKRTVTCIIIPNDIQEAKYEEPAREHGTIHSGYWLLSSTFIARTGRSAKSG